MTSTQPAAPAADEKVQLTLVEQALFASIATLYLKNRYLHSVLNAVLAFNAKDLELFDMCREQAENFESLAQREELLEELLEMVGAR